MALAWLDDRLLEIAQAQSAKALASGALVPLALDVRIVPDGEVAFEVRSAPHVAKKDLARALQSGAQSAIPYDPFEPFEHELFVADVATTEARGSDSTHVLVLNKFPTMAGHVVLITRRFAPQRGAPSREDFVALAQLTHATPGLTFYNGGPLAGASQEHRHFQLVPRTGAWPIDCALARAPARGAVPGLPFRHAFVRHDFARAAAPEGAADVLERAFRAACGDLDIDLSQPLLPPLNFLATREWLMVVPRTREHWIAEDTGGKVSVNALGFAGLLLARSDDLIAPLQRFGLLRMLDSVTR